MLDKPILNSYKVILDTQKSDNSFYMNTKYMYTQTHASKDS